MQYLSDNTFLDWAIVYNSTYYNNKFWVYVWDYSHTGNTQSIIIHYSHWVNLNIKFIDNSILDCSWYPCLNITIDFNNLPQNKILIKKSKGIIGLISYAKEFNEQQFLKLISIK